ncbi:MAG: O-antigen ligase family protein, partial [Candidatus Geothermincolales bacterium]
GAGIIAGLASSNLPAKWVFILLGGAVLFYIIYQLPWLGVAVAIFFNLTLPQAGPTWNLGIQVAVAGETRGIHFNIHEIVMALTFVAWAVRAFTGKSEWRRSSPIAFAILLYVITNIIACFVGVIHGGSVLVMGFRFIRTVVFVYVFFLVLNLIVTRRQILGIVVLMMICFTLVATFGLVQKAIGQAKTEYIAEKVLSRLGYPKEVNYVAGESQAQAYRINSTFLHPNVLGGYLVFALPFFVSLLSHAWRRRRRFTWFLLLVGLGVNLSALFLTGSRAAWVAAGCIALLYAAFGFADRRVWLTLATVAMVVALVLVMLNPPEFVRKRFTSLSAKEAAEARMYQYRMAFDFFLEHPFLGLGMGMEGQRIVEANMRETWVAVENAFLTYLVSHGLVGFVPFLSLFIVYWFCLFRTRKGSRDDPLLYFLSEAFLLGMVGYAVSNMFGAWLLFAIPMLTLFWFFLGMGASIHNLFRLGETAMGEVPAGESARGIGTIPRPVPFTG